MESIGWTMAWVYLGLIHYPNLVEMAFPCTNFYIWEVDFRKFEKTE